MLVSRGGHFGVAQLWLLVSVCEEAIALVSFWRLHAYEPAEGVATWHKQDDPHVVQLQDIMSSVVWSETSPPAVRTMIPTEFRRMSAV